MTPVEISFGERYEDNSGWKRLLKVRDRGDYSITISLAGSDMSCSWEDLEWLSDAITRAFKQMGHE